MANQSLSLGSAWDDEVLGRLTGELLLGRKHKKPAKSSGGSSGWSGASVPRVDPANFPGYGSKEDIRRRLMAIASKPRQVLVKIPKGGRKSAKQLAATFKYLTREGDEELLDHNGRVIGKGDLEGDEDLVWSWKHTGPQLDDKSDRKEAFHIIFSMPEGTDERAVLSAVRAAAAIEFAGHQYVMAQHHDEPQVHVHVLVKTEGFDGQRLNPRKADLDRWRERFAYELRERGVEAEATRRMSRLQQEKKRTPWAVNEVAKRAKKTTREIDKGRPALPDPERAGLWRGHVAKANDFYDGIIEKLTQSDSEDDRKLAKTLESAVRAARSQHRANDRGDRKDRSQDKQQTLERN